MILTTYSSANGSDLSEEMSKILTEEQLFRDYMDRNKKARQIARELEKAQKQTRGPKRKEKKTSQPRRRAQTCSQMEWLKKLICPFVYAEKTPYGIRPSVTKSEFIGRWNLHWGLPSLPNYKLDDHFKGLQTLYFMGHGWKKQNRVLAMIDIDVQKSKGLGSPEGAKRFAEHLKTIWPDLYFEVSTNGQGIHGYFLLWKANSDAERTNAALKRLEAWLTAEAKRTNADIEMVEIKGTCLDLVLDGKHAESVKFGVPAKLPRDVARFSEWQNTTLLRVCELESSAFDVKEERAASLPVFESDKSVRVPVVDFREGKVPICSGSVSSKFINDDELSSIPAFEELYREWVGPNDLMAGKFRVTAHDFAVAMVLLRYFKNDQNADRTLPVRRVAELWNGLYSAGDIQRGWNHHRWKRIRDFLSTRGHIDWTDNRFEIGYESNRGIACKWAITEDYDYWLQRVAAVKCSNIGGASFVDTSVQTNVPSQGSGKNLRPFSCQLKALLFWERTNRACDMLCAV